MKRKLRGGTIGHSDAFGISKSKKLVDDVQQRRYR